MYDLMYCGEKEIYDEIMKLVKKNYPDAEIQDGSDSIHRYRFSVDTKIEDDRDEFVKFLVREKLGGISFHLQMMMTNKDSQKKLIELINLVKAEGGE